MAYAENLYLLRTFMWDMTANLGYAFEDGTYNRLVLAFEPTFQSYVENLAREKCALFAGDKHFVGYYLDNELPFVAYENADAVKGIELKHFLALPDKYKGRGTSPKRSWRRRASPRRRPSPKPTARNSCSAVADHYFKVTSEAGPQGRPATPDPRIAPPRLEQITQGIVEACARYCDVVSVNYYARWQPEPGFMANLAVWCGNKPFIVTEFYVKGADANYKGRAYTNTDGGGWPVRTQKKPRGVLPEFLPAAARNAQLRRVDALRIQRRLRRHGGFEQGPRVGGVHPYADYLNLAKGAPHEPLPAGLLHDAER